MAIEKRFIHFKKFSDFNSKKLSANEANTQYTVGISGAIQNGSPDVLYQSYVWIKDTQQQWTHGQIYNGSDVDINPSQFISKDDVDSEVSETSTNPVQNKVVAGALNEIVGLLDTTLSSVGERFNSKQDAISDLETIRDGAAKGATAVQPEDIPIETYIADFTMESLKSGMNNGNQIDCDVQALVDAMNANKVILVREGEDSSYKGMYVLNGYAEDLLYFSIVDASGNILWCNGTDYNSQFIDGQTLRFRSWGSKQDTLVSGNNIKTINGTSILGSGDIEISGNSGTITGVSANGTSIATSGVADIPAASTSKYGVTKLSSATNSTSTSLAATASAVKSAYDLANGRQAKLVSGTNIKTINNTSILGSGNIAIDANIQAVDTQETLDDVNTNTYVKYVAQTLTDAQKAQVRENIGVSDTNGNNNYITWTDDELYFMGADHPEPNVKYICAVPITQICFHDAIDPEDSWHGGRTEAYNEYTFVFTAGDCTVTMADSIKWANGSQPTLENGVRYELSISLMYINNEYIGHAVLVPFKSV